MLDISTNKKDNSVGENAEVLVTESDLTGLNKISVEKIVQIFSIIILVIFVLMSGLLIFLESNKKTVLKNKESNFTNLNETLKSDQGLSQVNDLASQFDLGLGKISSFLITRPSWSVLLGELQKTTPADVVYKSINVSEKTYLVTASGETTNFSSVSLLLAALRESNKFSDIKLISTSKVEGEGSKVAFNIEFKVVTNNLKNTTK